MRRLLSTRRRVPTAMPEHMALTVGITTRNRPQSLLRCLASLDLLGDSLAEVIVVDDSSDVPVAGSLDLPPSLAAEDPGRETDRVGRLHRRAQHHHAPRDQRVRAPPGRRCLPDRRGRIERGARCHGARTRRSPPSAARRRKPTAGPGRPRCSPRRCPTDAAWRRSSGSRICCVAGLFTRSAAIRRPCISTVKRRASARAC